MKSSYQLIQTSILRIVALFYSYGALVHVMNIAGLTGFDWMDAPVKWQLLDIIYLVLDVVVAAGFFLGWSIAKYAFYIAAISQIFLYTILRDWIIDVPADFAVSSEQVEYLDILIIFHITTIALVSFALFLSYNNNKRGIHN